MGYQYGLHGKAKGKEAHKGKGQNTEARKHGDIRKRTWQ